MRSRTPGLVAILLAVFVDLLGVTIVTVALPSITTDLDASPAQAQAVLSGYTLTFAVGLITGARLGRLLGLRRAFVVGVVGFTLASLACGFADAASLLVAARVIEHKPASQRPYESVRAAIEQRLKREEALKLATADGEAKLKAAQEGKEAGLKWPAPLEVSRQKPGGLPPPVLDRVFRVDARKLPAVVGVSTPVGYALVRVTKVIDVQTIDDAKRKALGAQLRQTVALSELEGSLASLRSHIGVEIRKDAFEKKPN